MSEEREFIKHVDETILNASEDELFEIQKLDLQELQTYVQIWILQFFQ